MKMTCINNGDYLPTYWVITLSGNHNHMYGCQGNWVWYFGVLLACQSAHRFFHSVHPVTNL